MIDWYRTRQALSDNMEFLSTETGIMAGMCMVYAAEGGKGKVKKSAGSTETFAGFATCGNGLETKAPKIDTKVIPSGSPYTVTLDAIPSADADVQVRDVTGNNLMTQGSVADNVYSISGNVLTFAAADASHTIVITYKRNITALEWALLYGEGNGVGMASDIAGRISVMKDGIIYTDQFAAVDWTATVNDLKTGAGGLVTRAGSGGTINGSVIDAPTATSPWLGLRFAI